MKKNNGQCKACLCLQGLLSRVRNAVIDFPRTFAHGIKL